MLSRPHENVASQMSSLEVLHKLTTNRSIVFGAGNHELEFFGCLVFCLLQITDGAQIPTDGESRTQWHIKPESELTGEGEDATAHQGQQLLKNAASRVWEELYVSKRPALEEVFKSGFGTGSSNQTPGLEAVRETIAEPAGKVWHSYLDMEKRAVRTPAWEFQTQLESRIQRITGRSAFFLCVFHSQ